ncbi:hypothetical protein [Hyphomicrobium sp. LHD-15]|uniref:hypothetical protein n=1 Tax=Hyphomicrobium sp. LHD-15 TaxID=3072142 RepID=UPI00280C85F7|nr:hypothetical protein [Hyphomicrobium sp. LHD-15]MDQ8698449.1 hypothetical protein [Hyphomicrobium sp. LHD-15]
MDKTKIIAAIAIGFGVLAASGAANAYSGRVKSACKTDFYKFCPSYKPETPELRACMRAVGGNISQRCLDALADSGEIPRKYHSSQRKR